MDERLKIKDEKCMMTDINERLKMKDYRWKMKD